MTPKQRASHLEALTRLRAELVAAGPARIEPNRQDPATSGVADEDAQALSEMMQVLASQRNKGQADLLGRIDLALRKLATAPEDYGQCEDCEEPIALRRLQLMPYAVLCPACQARREPAIGGRRKNLTDYR
ncbi:MAG: TraR/DksA C4-type zinc finger protein [Anaeromyxobacter sp.]|nr:TraR/DksA C4-type zinc finger protein [Anaeromyxobacter sp.]MBL0274908.1 TraR/DksA C4-type zinc finger protein [Anaeromyxobacter sp.]